MSSKCLPCREGCPYCRDDTPCLIQEDGALRLAVASFQGLCMVLDLGSMVVVYHFRRNKVRGGETGCNMWEISSKAYENELKLSPECEEITGLTP